MTYARILVPTDLSDFAVHAVRWAGLLRQRFGAQVTLLHADETYVPFDAIEIPVSFYLEDALEGRSSMARRLRDYADEHLGADGVETRIVQEAPARAILRVAREIDADLVVMGTHGRRGWRRALLGSVSETVLHQCDRPVVTVNPQVLPESRPLAMHSVLCPVNFSYLAREALQHASALASAFEAQLVVLYVGDGTSAPRVDEIEAAFGSWLDEPARSNAHYRFASAAERDPATRVLEVADEIAADLIVVGAEHKLISDNVVIGTTARSITRFARCPVLTVMHRERKPVHNELPEETVAHV